MASDQTSPVKKPKKAEESEATKALQSIVLELANQVKGLQGLVSTQLEEKNQWKEQQEQLNSKYFNCLADLRKDITNFKTKLATENQTIYSQFQQQLQSLSNNMKPDER